MTDPRDPDRIEPMLRAIRIAWLKTPDIRLGQLLLNIAAVTPGRDLFYLEDSTLMTGLTEYPPPAFRQNTGVRDEESCPVCGGKPVLSKDIYPPILSCAKEHSWRGKGGR
jgi:hypothetical protein